MTAVWRVILVVLMGLILVGCATGPQDSREAAVVIERGSAPTYEEVASIVNQRAAALERVAQYSTLHVWYTDEDGKESEDQFEVRVRLAQPERVYMEFLVATVSLAILGCDEEEYWWVNIRDERWAWLGSHEKTTPELMAKFVLPVHPQDFVLLLGMTAIPEEKGDATVAWSSDGRYLVVETASRFGRQRMMLVPVGDEYQRVRIELLDKDGKLSVSADLAKYESVVITLREEPQWVAREIWFKLASGKASGRYRPRYLDSREVKDRMFDRDRLFKHYRIGPDDVELLDDQMAGGAIDD